MHNILGVENGLLETRGSLRGLHLSHSHCREVHREAHPGRGRAPGREGGEQRRAPAAPAGAVPGLAPGAVSLHYLKFISSKCYTCNCVYAQCIAKVSVFMHH